MRANLGPSVDLNFLDGYLFRLIQEIGEGRGVEESGLGSYYAWRLESRAGGLAEYEERLTRFLVENYAGRCIVHAGTGLGTLACALACNGMSVLGLERDRLRFDAACKLRAAVVKTWPEVDSRYRLKFGPFPMALEEGPSDLPQGASLADLDSNAILVFTNVVATWDDEHKVAIYDALPRFSEVILDLRLFGDLRDDQADREALFERIASSAQSAERLADIASGMYLARFVFSNPA